MGMMGFAASDVPGAPGAFDAPGLSDVPGLPDAFVDESVMCEAGGAGAA